MTSFHSHPEMAELDRRAFATTGLAAGFALAVLPVSAATITTDANGLTAGEVKIPTKDGAIPAYRAMPAAGASFPAILVIHEVFGVHEHIKDVCRRLAKSGYYAVAPLLCARHGDVSKLTDLAEIMKIVGQATDEEIKNDLGATVEFLKGEKGDASRLGVTGFCWGGHRAWVYTAQNPLVKASAAWYGRLVNRPGSTAASPLELAAKMDGRVIGFYGGKDAMISLDTIEQMRAALKSAGDEKSQIIVYPEADHGFNADYRPSYNEAAAKDAWAKMLDWFKSRGVV